MCFEALSVYSCGCPHPSGTVRIFISGAPNCTSSLRPTCPAWFPLCDMKIPTMYTYTWDSCPECENARDEGKERGDPNEMGCFSCRVRRIRCGKEQPFCSQCKIPGRKCLGYARLPQVLPPPVLPRSQQMIQHGVSSMMASPGALKNSVTDAEGSVLMLEGYGVGNISWRDYVLGNNGFDELEKEKRETEIGKVLGG